jgi:hypothetical protein
MKTNKQTTYPKFKIILVIVGIIIFSMQSCSTEEEILETKASKKNYITSEKVSIENVLRVLKNPIILEHTENLNNYSLKNIAERSNNKSNVYFTKIVKGNEYTTYQLLLNSYSTKNPYFMYYVITYDGITEKVGYLKYIPNSPTYILDIAIFSGKIQMLDLHKKIKLEISLINGQPKTTETIQTQRTNDDCITSPSIVTHYCGSNLHLPGQTCTHPIKAYYEVKFNTICTYSSAYDNSTPVPTVIMENLDNSFGGGSPFTVDFITSFEAQLTPRQKQWWDSYNNVTKKQEIISFLNQNPTDEGRNFSLEMINAMRANLGLNIDVDASFKSPFNIDKSTIKDVTEEDKKFNAVYKALTDSPAFKNLFLALFENNNKRFNVKFEIIENLDNNTRKIDGFTTPPDQKGGPTLIQINKQILTSTGLRPMTNIEIAKTILHECIHAYLAIKGKYPDAGGSSVPGIENMTFAEVLKATRPGTGAQHDFMYKNMVPTMQKILAEIRDAVTSSTTRATVESIMLQPNFYTNPKSTTLWKWNDYFYYLSLKGLQDAEAFKISFPANTDQFELFLEYNFFGHKHLKN